MSGTRPDAPAAIPAATLILLRPQAGDADEVLMLERAATMRFAAGALVFPGGRVDAGDLALAGGDVDGAARIAAIRETIEEAGVAVGLDPPPGPAAIARLREGLHAGEPFGALLDAVGCRLRSERLVPFARWQPGTAEIRVFDTRFYLAEAPAGSVADADGAECVRALWSSAASILAAAATGLHSLLFPTRCNLDRLARFAGFADAAADARSRAVTLVQPQVVKRDGIDWLTIPEGIGYPITAERLETIRRG